MWRFWKNVQVDPMLPTRQISQSKLDGHLSKSVKMRGVPRGKVISQTLFLLYISNITTVLPRHVSNTLHADDLAVWSSSEYITSSAYRIQEAVNKAEQWTNDWGLQISEVKTQFTSFLPLNLQRKSHHKACKRRKGKGATPITSVPQRSQNSYPQ